jgi:hypothetical protein
MRLESTEASRDVGGGAVEHDASECLLRGRSPVGWRLCDGRSHLSDLACRQFDGAVAGLTVTQRGQIVSIELESRHIFDARRHREPHHAPHLLALPKLHGLPELVDEIARLDTNRACEEQSQLAAVGGKHS